MLNSVSIGKKIYSLRNLNNLNQEQLGEKLLVSRQAISKWELGLTLPSIDNLVELVRIFQVSLEELLCLNERLDINIDNIFENHERLFIVRRACSNKLGDLIYQVFDQFTMDERILILYSFKVNKINWNNAYNNILTTFEKNYLEGKYEISDDVTIYGKRRITTSSK